MNNRLDTIMQDTALRKAFGARVKDLRKSRGWSQKQLAAQIEIRFQLLNKYEGGQHIPPIETIIKLSDTFQTTLDFLLLGNPQQEQASIDDTLFRRFQALGDFNSEDKQTIITVIDALITKHQVERAIKPVA